MVVKENALECLKNFACLLEVEDLSGRIGFEGLKQGLGRLCEDDALAAACGHDEGGRIGSSVRGDGSGVGMRDKRRVMGKTAGKGTGGRSEVWQVFSLRPSSLPPHPPFPCSLPHSPAIISLTPSCGPTYLQSRSCLHSIIALRINLSHLLHNQTHLFLAHRSIIYLLSHVAAPLHLQPPLLRVFASLFFFFFGDSPSYSVLLPRVVFHVIVTQPPPCTLDHASVSVVHT